MTNRTDKLNTSKSLQTVFFADFSTSFKKHPNTGDLARLTNDEAVKQSIKNLVLTNYGERLFQPNIGGNVRSYLFEPMDDFSANFLSDSIKQTIFNSEIRISSLEVFVDANEDDNEYNVSIGFTVHHKPDVVNVELILKRLR